MPYLHELLPDDEIAFELASEEMAGTILRYLRDECSSKSTLELQLHHINTFAYPDVHHGEQQKRRSRMKIAVREAWHWLETQGFLIPEEGKNGDIGYRELSRSGEALAVSEDARRFVDARKLPREILHPMLKETVWAQFARGEYEEAVFHTMKTVEVHVRESAGYDQSSRGSPMLRNAFNTDNGPLTDQTIDRNERQALGNLFDGAYGYFRNPSAHRNISMDSPEEAMEIILLGNHLMRIVDAATNRS